MSDVRNHSVNGAQTRSQPSSVPPRDDVTTADSTAVPRLVDLPVKQVLADPDSALNLARRRVVAEQGRDDQHYAAHGSSPVAPPVDLP